MPLRAALRQRLRRAAQGGFENVYNLRGGVMAWASANLPLQKPVKNKKKRK